MKKVKSTLFLFLATFVLLVGCESYTASHADPNATSPQGTKQPDQGAQDAAPKPALQPPTPAQQQDQDTKTNPNARGSVNLTDNEVKDILNGLIPKAVAIYGTFNGNGAFQSDATKTIPDEKDYCLVTGGRQQNEKSPIENVKSIADLKKVVEDVFTKDIAQKVFYSRYLTSEKARPLYKDYEGQLYVDIRNEGHGWARKFLIDTAKIKSQKDHVAEITLDTTSYDTPDGILILKIEYVNGKWLMASGLDDYESIIIPPAKK